ncbi:MAG: isoamylase early set domain-containing protein [Kiritimatiellia bacterium]
MNTEQDKRFDPKQDILSDLSSMKLSAPPAFVERVMQRLPPKRAQSRRWWPEGHAWIAPALTGAAAALLMATFLQIGHLRNSGTELVAVNFELHAPDADQVELVGDFTSWQTGRILLEGPDASGHWTGRVELPAGRHEYLFLVDGRQWMTDPMAMTHRPDGFGNLNAVMNL